MRVVEVLVRPPETESGGFQRTFNVQTLKFKLYLLKVYWLNLNV